jgi:hypothetical protein
MPPRKGAEESDHAGLVQQILLWGSAAN